MSDLELPQGIGVHFRLGFDRLFQSNIEQWPSRLTVHVKLKGQNPQLTSYHRDQRDEEAIAWNGYPERQTTDLKVLI